MIRTASHVTGPRGDQKNGCRVEWLAYCEEKGVKSRMTSYRSNRFNSYFEGAAAIIHHRRTLVSFFQSLGHSNLKTQSVEVDLADNRLLAFVAAVALLYIHLTGPYWELLQSDVKYTNLYQYINPMLACFDRWSRDASELLNPNYPGVFDGSFQLGDNKAPLKDSLFEFVGQADISEHVQSALQQMMKPLMDVTTSQLSDFIAGNIYGGPPAPVPEGMGHCPLTNLLGENVFGDYDFNMGKRRHCSNHHRTTTHMLRHNKTAKWLSRKWIADTTSLMEFARKKGRSLRLHHRQQERLVILKIREKLVEDERKKNLRLAKQANVKRQLLGRLFVNGGACETEDDVHALIHRLRRDKPSVLLEAVKDQIRYQKTILGRKGTLRLSGSVEDLILALKTHLSDPAVSQPQHQPQPCRQSDDEDFDFDGGDAEFDEPPEKRPRQDDDSDSDSEDETTFSYGRQGQWVAVFYDDRFYVGQVIEVEDGQSGIVKYLEPTNGRKDYFRWPRSEDVARTSANYVFKSNFDVKPVSNDGRVWEVEDIDDIASGYQYMKEKLSSF